MNMMNGFVILGTVALLFFSMYVYAYIFVYIERVQNKKQKKEDLHNEELRAQEKIRKQQFIDEKVNKIAERSKQIKRELRELEQIKVNQLKAQEAH